MTEVFLYFFTVKTTFRYKFSIKIFNNVLLSNYLQCYRVLVLKMLVIIEWLNVCRNIQQLDFSFGRIHSYIQV